MKKLSATEIYYLLELEDGSELFTSDEVERWIDNRWITLISFWYEWENYEEGVGRVPSERYDKIIINADKIVSIIKCKIKKEEQNE